jgi:hypothetical protein
VNLHLLINTKPTLKFNAMKKNLHFVFALGAVLFVSACGGGMSGKYIDKNEMIEIEFKSGSQFVMSTMGVGREGKYSKDGDSVKLEFGAENIILKLDKDGCILYPMIGSLCKR